jgi:hypothetical protein
MKLVYVAGPYSSSSMSGVAVNIARADCWGKVIAHLGHMPVIPHTNTSHPEYAEIQPYGFWLEGTSLLLARCDLVLMIPGWQESTGSKLEEILAGTLGIRTVDAENYADMADAFARTEGQVREAISWRVR